MVVPSGTLSSSLPLLTLVSFFPTLQRLKYQATLSSVHALNLSADSVALLSPAHSTGCPTPTSKTTHMPNQSRQDIPTEISHTHISRLRRKKQLMAVQLEKTDNEIQRKREELSRDRTELEKIRCSSRPHTVCLFLPLVFLIHLLTPFLPPSPSLPVTGHRKLLPKKQQTFSTRSFRLCR